MEDTVCLYCAGELGRITDCIECGHAWSIDNGNDSGVYAAIIAVVRKDREALADPLSDRSAHIIAAGRYRHLVGRGFLE